MKHAVSSEQRPMKSKCKIRVKFLPVKSKYKHQGLVIITGEIEVQDPGSHFYGNPCRSSYVQDSLSSYVFLIQLFIIKKQSTFPKNRKKKFNAQHCA